MDFEIKALILFTIFFFLYDCLIRRIWGDFIKNYNGVVQFFIYYVIPLTILGIVKWVTILLS